MADKLIYYIPEGIPNIKDLFPGVDFDQVASWSVNVKDDSDNVLATSRKNEIGCCCNESIRIHFINSMGEIDSINFSRPEQTHETKSDSWEQALRFPLDRSKFGTRRSGITAGDTIDAETKCYGEDDQYWIMELSDAPMAWLETYLPRGFGTPTQKAYIPVTVLDMKFPLKKVQARYEYLVRVKLAFANSKITLR